LPAVANVADPKSKALLQAIATLEASLQATMAGQEAAKVHVTASKARQKKAPRCKFCGKTGHLIKDCEEADEYVLTGRCTRDTFGRIVLSSGVKVPPEVGCKTLQERCDRYRRQSTQRVQPAPMEMHRRRHFTDWRIGDQKGLAHIQSDENRSNSQGEGTGRAPFVRSTQQEGVTVTHPPLVHFIAAPRQSTSALSSAGARAPFSFSFGKENRPRALRVRPVELKPPSLSTTATQSAQLPQPVAAKRSIQLLSENTEPDPEEPSDTNKVISGQEIAPQNSQEEVTRLRAHITVAGIGTIYIAARRPLVRPKRRQGLVKCKPYSTEETSSAQLRNYRANKVNKSDAAQDTLSSMRGGDIPVFQVGEHTETMPVDPG
jgi:hypothetical protein